MLIKAIFYGRGGQGAKSSADIFAKSAIYQDYYGQSFSKFGAEKSGTPVYSFLRISDKEIRTHEPFEKADILVILDDTLLVFNPDIVDFIDNTSKIKMIMINCDNPKIIERVKQSLNEKKINANIFRVDATGIAIKHIGRNVPNTSLLAKLYKLLEEQGYDFNLNKLKQVVQELFEHKGKDIVEKNIQAIDFAYNCKTKDEA